MIYLIVTLTSNGISSKFFPQVYKSFNPHCINFQVNILVKLAKFSLKYVKYVFIHMIFTKTLTKKLS